jgi:hypothetical protein
MHHGDMAGHQQMAKCTDTTWRQMELVFRLLSKIAGERWIGEGACGVVVWVNSATASG